MRKKAKGCILLSEGDISDRGGGEINQKKGDLAKIRNELPGKIGEPQKPLFLNIREQKYRNSYVPFCNISWLGLSFRKIKILIKT